MKIFTTQDVMDGAEINILHQIKGDWIVASRSDFEPQGEDGKESLFEIEMDYLLERIPKLKGNLDQPENTSINIDYATGEINVNKQHFHIGIPTHSAKATRQTNVSFSWFHYLSLHANGFLKVAGILLVLILAANYFHWLIYIPAGIFLAFKGLELFKTRDIYLSGALGPAIVIDAANHKIAALTDVSLGFGDYPLLRIKITKLPKKYLVNGTMIPVAGGYQNTHKYSHWNYYEPNPIPTATNNEKIIEEKIKAIPGSEWLKLKQEIKKFDEIPLEGYYPIDIETTNWKDMDLSEIHWNNFGKEKGNVQPESEELKASREKFEASKAEFKKGKGLKDIWNEFKDDMKKAKEEANEEWNKKE